MTLEDIDTVAAIVEVEAPLTCEEPVVECPAIDAVARALIRHARSAGLAIVDDDAPLPACTGPDGEDGRRLVVDGISGTGRGLEIRMVLRCRSGDGPQLHVVIYSLSQASGRWVIADRIHVVS